MLKNKYFKIISFTLIILLFMISFIGCDDKNTSSNLKKVEIHTDYRVYDNLDSIAKKADIILIGNITSVNEPTKINISADKNEPLEVVYTVSQIEVTKVIKGDLNIGNSIQIKQRGGVYGDTDYICNDVEYLKNNQNRIFFLQSYDQYNLEESMPYSLLNPLQGSIEFVNGKIKNREYLSKENKVENPKALDKSKDDSSEIAKDNELELIENGVSEEEVIDMLTNIIEN